MSFSFTISESMATKHLQIYVFNLEIKVKVHIESNDNLSNETQRLSHWNTLPRTTILYLRVYNAYRAVRASAARRGNRQSS